MSALPIILKQRSESVGLFTRARERELGLDRRETGRFLSTGSAGCLRGKDLQYERNEVLVPLVYRLSDKAGRAATHRRIRAECI